MLPVVFTPVSMIWREMCLAILGLRGLYPLLHFFLAFRPFPIEPIPCHCFLHTSLIVQRRRSDLIPPLSLRADPFESPSRSSAPLTSICFLRLFSIDLRTAFFFSFCSECHPPFFRCLFSIRCSLELQVLLLPFDNLSLLIPFPHRMVITWSTQPSSYSCLHTIRRFSPCAHQWLVLTPRRSFTTSYMLPSCLLSVSTRKESPCPA